MIGHIRSNSDIGIFDSINIISYAIVYSLFILITDNIKYL